MWGGVVGVEPHIRPQIRRVWIHIARATDPHNPEMPTVSMGGHPRTDLSWRKGGFRISAQQQPPTPPPSPSPVSHTKLHGITGFRVRRRGSRVRDPKFRNRACPNQGACGMVAIMAVSATGLVEDRGGEELQIQTHVCTAPEKKRHRGRWRLLPDGHKKPYARQAWSRSRAGSQQKDAMRSGRHSRRRRPGGGLMHCVEPGAHVTDQGTG